MRNVGFKVHKFEDKDFDEQGNLILPSIKEVTDNPDKYELKDYLKAIELCFQLQHKF